MSNNQYKWDLFVEKNDGDKNTIHQVFAESCTQGTSSVNGDILIIFNLGKNITANETGYEIEVKK